MIYACENGMKKPSLSAYKEFENRLQARRAVRALAAAGFEDIETEDFHGLQTAHDVGAPSPRKSFIFELSGLICGIVGGVVLGILLFGVPSDVLNFPHSGVVTVVGVLICAGAGSVIGLIEGAIFAKRSTWEPTSRKGKVGVRVRVRTAAEVIEAKTILSQFGELPHGRVASWLRVYNFSK